MIQDFKRPVRSPKYQSQNIVARYLIQTFFKEIECIISTNILDKNQEKILEIGAGEGHISDVIIPHFPYASFYITDIYEERLAIAKERLQKYRKVDFLLENILSLNFPEQYFDLVICCEVLEHIENYELALNQIYNVLKPGAWFLASVPREPIWRMLNLARLKYILRLGNTPTHVNHWSTKSFKSLLERNGFSIVDSKTPLPWTVLLCKKR